MNTRNREQQRQAWDGLSAELGSPIHACVLGKMLVPNTEIPPGEWGLYLATDAGLFYRHDPATGFLSGFIPGVSTSAPRRLSWLWESFVSVEYFRETFWKRLFGGENDQIRLVRNQAADFIIEPLEGGDVWVQAVRDQTSLRRSLT